MILSALFASCLLSFYNSLSSRHLKEGCAQALEISGNHCLLFHIFLYPGFFFFSIFLTLNSQDLAEVLQLTGCSVDEHFLQTCNGGEGTKKYLLCIFIAKNVPS